MIREKKVNLFKNIALFFCLVPMLILSIFCLVPQKQEYEVAAADVSVSDFSFFGSNFIVPTTSHTYTGEIDLVTLISNRLIISCTGGVYSVTIDGDLLRSNMSSTRDVNFVCNNVTPRPLDYQGIQNFRVVYYQNYYLNVECNLRGYLTSDINRIAFSSVTGNGVIRNSVTYYDSVGNYISIVYEIPTGYFDAFAYDYRVYYLNVITDDTTPNEYYQSGYLAGYNDGVVDGSSTGYNEGYNAGVTAGYNEGYDAGIEVGNDYTFSNLFGAVIDVPVNAFKSLINFELLGVNLLGLFTGLLSFGIIILIVKLCMGGR